MSAITDALDTFLATMTIVGGSQSAAPGMPLSFSLAPGLSTLSIVDIIEQPMSLDLIAKNVDFSNVTFADPGNAGVATPGWIQDAMINNLPGEFDLTRVPPTLDKTVVPGLIGKLIGKLPIAIPRTIAPTLTVEWKIKDENGGELSEGEAYSTVNGTHVPTLDIAFVPGFVEFTGGAVTTVTRTVEAKVTLAAGTETASAPVGPVSVQIPTLALPRVLALTVDTNFLGAALILVPADSPVAGLAHLQSLLQPVRNVLQALATIAALADFILGIETLASIVQQTNIQFRAGAGWGNLNDITLVQNAWYNNDIEAEGELSSFVYLSPPPGPENNPTHSVVLYNKRHFDEKSGAMMIQTGTLWIALCRSLAHKHPPLIPDDVVRTIVEEPGGTFNDSLSSILFNLHTTLPV